jgi:hypothetical protein
MGSEEKDVAHMTVVLWEDYLRKYQHKQLGLGYRTSAIPK